MDVWRIVKLVVIGLVMIFVIVPLVFIGYFMVVWSNNICYPTSYQLTLMGNTEEFDQPYLNKTSFDFDTFPTLKNAMSQLFDLDSLVPTGKNSSRFNNCDNEVDEYFLSFISNNSMGFRYFAYYHHIFELIETGAV